MATKETQNLTDLAAQWRTARRIYPIYSGLARQFNLSEPCRQLESPINRSEPEVMVAIKSWFDHMDSKVQAFQLRQLLQTTHLGSEESLRAMLHRYLRKPQKSEAIRDKVDYLLVQYFAHRAPEDAHNSHVTFEHVAEVMSPVIGECTDLESEVKPGLEAVLSELAICQDLGDLLGRKLIEKARE